GVAVENWHLQHVAGLSGRERERAGQRAEIGAVGRAVRDGVGGRHLGVAAARASEGQRHTGRTRVARVVLADAAPQLDVVILDDGAGRGFRTDAARTVVGVVVFGVRHDSDREGLVAFGAVVRDDVDADLLGRLARGELDQAVVAIAAHAVQ